MQPHTLIFDWDNTLVDTWPVIHAALNNTFSELDMPHWSLETLKARVVHLTDRDYLADRMFGPDKDRARHVFAREFERVHLAELTPMPGAGALLARLAASGRLAGDRVQQIRTSGAERGGRTRLATAFLQHHRRGRGRSRQAGA